MLHYLSQDGSVVVEQKGRSNGNGIRVSGERDWNAIDKDGNQSATSSASQDETDKLVGDGLCAEFRKDLGSWI